MRANRLREIWQSGQPASNCWLTLPTALGAEILAHQDWDSLTIDMQHGRCDFAAVYAMLTAIWLSQRGPKHAMLYAGDDYLARANATVLTIAGVETAKGLKNVAEIAATTGLDMLYAGPSDLGPSLGREAKADKSNSAAVDAFDTILRAAKAVKRWGGIHCCSVDYARAMAAKGFDLVTAPR